MADYQQEQIIAQDALIYHFKNLVGYTESAVTQAIKEIREDNPVKEGEEPEGLPKMMLDRADDMERSLSAIREAMG